MTTPLPCDWQNPALTHRNRLPARSFFFHYPDVASAQTFDRARHTIDLVPRDEVIVHLDWRHNGIGSASCGPGPADIYLLKPEAFRFAVRLSPFKAGSSSPMALSKHPLESV